MKTRASLVSLAIVLLAMSAVAQTNVTNSNNGTANAVPVYTGTSALSGNSPIAINGSNVGIGTTAPENLLDLGGGGIGAGLHLGYWEFAQTSYMADAYLSVNAKLTTSSIPNSTNYFSPRWSPGQGMVLAQMGGGSGSITFYGINWNGSSTPQLFPNAFTPVLALQYSGNVGIGTTSPAYNLDIAGVARAQSGIVFPDGNKQTTAWTGVLCGGDYAEAVELAGSKKQYEPGDVLVLSSENENDVQKSSEPYSTMVAGIFATRPGVIGRRESLSKGADELPMAMVGIVPTKVTTQNGPIRKGDLLVTSSRSGYAMRGTHHARMLGAVIGKAMGNLDSGSGVIEVLVTLQ